MSDEALEPCPFCGGEAKYYYYTPRDQNIECESCSNGTCLHESKAEAITAWNTRTEADRIEALQADNAKMREALHFYADCHPRPSEGPWGVNSQDFGNVARKALQETDDDRD